MNLLLGVSGSVAAVKVPELVSLFKDTGKVNIRIVSTEKALHFFKREDCLDTEVFTDQEEWKAWEKIGDPVVHIELCKWGDVFLIAPLDANTLAKLANGICDNVLTCTARAWQLPKPFYVAPAMNTFMWEHPITSDHLSRLESFGYHCIQPISKTLACGDIGMGAMAGVQDITKAVLKDL